VATGGLPTPVRGRGEAGWSLKVQRLALEDIDVHKNVAPKVSTRNVYLEARSAGEASGEAIQYGSRSPYCVASKTAVYRSGKWGFMKIKVLAVALGCAALLSACGTSIQKDASYKDVMALRDASVGIVSDPKCENKPTQDAKADQGWQATTCCANTVLLVGPSRTMEQDPALTALACCPGVSGIDTQDSGPRDVSAAVTAPGRSMPEGCGACAKRRCFSR